jgi:hypothetical protein
MEETICFKKTLAGAHKEKMPARRQPYYQRIPWKDKPQDLFL